MVTPKKSIYASNFVLGEDEVKLTGRCAIKTLPGNKTLTLVEVTPSDENNGTWKKFVQRASLLEIQDYKGE